MGWAYVKQENSKNLDALPGITSELTSPVIRLQRAIARRLPRAAALQAERDALEQALEKRSKQLEEVQLTRNLEMQRFAEFGRLSANLIHEIANPLAAASLSLEAVGDYNNPFVKRAQQNLRHLERYMQAARQQLQDRSAVVDFSARHEIERIKLIINPLASKSGVSVIYDIDRSILLHGDPIKFNQIIANLIVNAIDAYENVTADVGLKRILVKANQQSSSISFNVIDWGCGIQDDVLEHIFEPFYTTKQRLHNRGLGIGLAMVKQMTELDFGGTIQVTSSPLNGTIFTLDFPFEHLT